MSSEIEKRHLEARDYVAAEVAAGLLKDIPQLPQYATDLAVKLLLDETKAQEVVEGIRHDPSLAALILKRVNSPYYGLPSNVSDYHRACLLLGFNNVYRIVVENALHSIMPDTEQFRQIQQQSLLVSLICHEIAACCKKVDGRLVTTAGLLHEIGRSVVLLLQRQKPERVKAIEAMDDVFVGEALLRSWGLPDRLVNVVGNQHLLEYASPSDFPVDCRRELSVLGLAKMFGKCVVDDNVESGTFAPEVDQYLDTLGILNFGCAAHFFRKRVLPELVRQKKSLPQAMRRMLPDDGPD